MQQYTCEEGKHAIVRVTSYKQLASNAAATLWLYAIKLLEVLTFHRAARSVQLFANRKKNLCQNPEIGRAEHWHFPAITSRRTLMPKHFVEVGSNSVLMLVL